MALSRWREREVWEKRVKEEWVRLFAGVDFPREVEWMEIRRLFGGGLMAVGMEQEV